MLDLATTKKPRRKTYSDSTLMNMRKADLVEYIRTLEHNYDVAIQFNDQQAKNCEELLKDVRPVVRGKWINHKPFDAGRLNCNECNECSVCGTWFGADCYTTSNFCPRCGADMREENQNGNQ